MNQNRLSMNLKAGLDDKVSITNECHYAFSYEIASGYNLLNMIFSKWLSIIYAIIIRNIHSIREKRAEP